MDIKSIAHDTARNIWEAAKNAANDQRKRDQEKRFDYYRDGQLAYLEYELKRFFSEPEKFQLVFFNIVKKIIGNLAMVYIEPPKREVIGSQRDKDTFEAIASDCALSLTLKDASKLVKLLKTVLIRPLWANGQMRLDIILPHLVDVETGDSPKDLKTVLVTHYPDSGRNEDITFRLWTPERIQTLNWQGHPIDSEPNPYGILPFVPIWDGEPIDTFWLQGGDDLITAQDAINAKLVDLLHVMRLQGFGIPFIKGADLGQEVRFSPGDAVTVPENGDFGFASPEAPMKDVWDIIQGMIKQVAINNGLSAASLTTDPKEESGVSKIVGNRELMEMRNDDVERFRVYERQLFQVMKTVWNTHNPSQKFSDGAELKVDFFDLRKPISEEERRANWEADLAMGVITQVDIIMERNPDLKSRDEALEHLLKLQEERGRLQNVGTTENDQSFLN